MFIKEITPTMLDVHIAKFCALTGMEYIDLNDMIFPMVIEKYGRYDAMLLPNATKDFVTSGKKAPSKFAFNFICGVLNDYIQSNYATIPKIENSTPYVPRIESKEELDRQFDNNYMDLKSKWIDVHENKKMVILPLMMMKICWNGLLERGLAQDDFSDSQIANMVQFLMDYEARYIEHLRHQSTSANTKTIYDTLQNVVDHNKKMDMYIGASKFALFINNQ